MLWKQKQKIAQNDKKSYKGQKMTSNYQFYSVTLYTSRTVDYLIKIFGTQV